jgi:predicted secreted hydrolase
MEPEKGDALILQTGDTQNLPFWTDRSWKRYPFAYEGAEEHFTLPAAVGWHPGCDSQSWDIEAHVKAEESGKRYSFIYIYSYNRMGRLFGFNCRMLNVADISEKRHYVDRRYHFRPFPGLFRPPCDIKEGNLDITYHPRGRSIERWYAKRDSSGNLLPFEYHLEASSNGKAGARINLSVDLEALKPPLLDGAMDYRGMLTMFGQPYTFAFCLSPRVKVRGTLELGDKTENIEGIAKIGLQWAPDHFGKRNRPIKRIKHECFSGHLSNGWDFGIWRQYETMRYNRLMPFSGIFALFEDNTMVTTNDYTLEPVSYLKCPGWSKETKPIFRTGPKDHYVTHAARLTIPEWDADLVITPILEDNTQAVFVEYYFGPTEITGRVRGKDVYGVGFSEGTKLWYQEHELIKMMQNTLKNLPDQAFVGSRASVQRKLINDLEDALTAAQVNDKSRAKELLRGDLALISENIREEMIGAPAVSLSDLCRDLVGRL